MKKIIVLTILLIFAPLRFASAQGAPMPVQIVGIDTNVVTYLCDQIYNKMAAVYNKYLSTWAGLLYEYDSQLNPIIDTNQNLTVGDDAVSSGVKQAVGSQIASSLQGMRQQTAQQLQLGKVLGDDDIINGLSGGFSIFSSISDSAIADLIAKSKQAQQLQQQGDNNTAFNVETLLAPKTYNKTEQQNAAGYLEQVEAAAPPPPVIRFGNLFDVPVLDSDHNNSATIGKLSDKDLTKLISSLQTNTAKTNYVSKYRDYKNSYRSMITARSVYLANLLHSYQQRMPQKNGKSVAEMQNDLVNMRLTPDYYKAMATAAPATVARESLFLLAQISGQLNALHKQNERMIIMNSISGLNQLGISTIALTAKAQDIGRIIYCDPTLGHTDSKICKSGSTSVDTSELTGEQSGS